LKVRDLSKLKKNLPRIPGIHRKEEYFNSVVLIPLMVIGDEYHFIFQKRSLNIRQGGEISFPGGMYDPMEDKNIKHTALRETFEEMGIPKDRVTIIGAVDTLVAPQGMTVDAFIGIVHIDSLNELSINKDEVEYAFTVPVSYFEKNEPEKYKARVTIEPSYIDKDGREVVLFPAKDLDIPEIYRKPWGSRFINIYVYKVQGEVIWGITARLVYDFVNRLK